MIHCHAPHVSGFAAASRPVPIVLIEAACAPMMRSGTAAFAELMLGVIGQGNAAVMGQHGLVVCGQDLKRAYATTVAVEDSARACLFARQLGTEPVPIPRSSALNCTGGGWRVTGQQRYKADRAIGRRLTPRNLGCMVRRSCGAPAS